MVTDSGGEPLNVGRKTRKIPPALRRAVILRDGGCTFPGCTHDRFLDCHHLEHWAHGDPTDKANLVTLCPFHHRAMHEGAFTGERDDDGQPVFRTPEGRVLPAVHRPRQALRGAELLQALVEEQVALALHDETAYPGWDGTTPDYAACVASVLPAPG